LSFNPELTRILQLNPYASLAWGLLSKIPEVRLLSCLVPGHGALNRLCSTCCQVLLQQVQRDESIETLLEAIRDAFEFAEEADTLRSIKPESRQVSILREMLECVSESAKFIKSYAEDVNLGMSSSPLSLVITNM
jgi:hypothetical protein